MRLKDWFYRTTDKKTRWRWWGGGRRKVAHMQLYTALIHCALAGAVKGSDERSDSSVASSDVAATPAPSDSSMAAEPAAARTADENAEKAAGVGGAEGLSLIHI